MVVVEVVVVATVVALSEDTIVLTVVFGIKKAISSSRTILWVVSLTLSSLVSMSVLSYSSVPTSSISSNRSVSSARSVSFSDDNGKEVEDKVVEITESSIGAPHILLMSVNMSTT